MRIVCASAHALIWVGIGQVNNDTEADLSGALSLVDVVQMNPIGIDDYADVRHLHAQAFRVLGGTVYSDIEVAAFTRQVNSVDYVERLRSRSCYGAWIDDFLVGTCSWSATGYEGTTARISDVFVNPLFTGAGIGRMLVGYAETQARKAGLSSFSLRVGYHAAPLFLKLGYETTSQGVYHLADEVPLAVVFMRKLPETEASA